MGTKEVVGREGGGDGFLFSLGDNGPNLPPTKLQCT